MIWLSCSAYVTLRVPVSSGLVGFESFVWEVRMAGAAVSTAGQVQKVAALLGAAVLRWRDQGESFRILANSLPEQLEFRCVSSFSVTSPNDRASGPAETGSRLQVGEAEVVLGTTTEDRDADCRSDLATEGEDCRSAIRRDRKVQCGEEQQ